MTFRRFFKALHGVTPFPWQERLAAQVAEEGWPSVIGLPTASGKTACIDIAIYALATEKVKAGAPRCQPRRIAFVVDRRLVVDEAYERACMIAAKLEAAKDGAVAEVAGMLRGLSGSSDAGPLATAILRGGIYRDDAWARSPAQPTVLVSTVDQVGSRLLFRGYGVSPKAWAIHAGLLGNDTLYLVDEAHCARPFVETLEAIGRYRGWAERPVAMPFVAVSLSATPAQRGRAVFGPDKDDRDDPVLGRRLTAKKQAQLIVAKPRDEGFVSEVARLAEALAPGRRAVGVVVNRVAAARAIHARLDERVRGGKLDADIVLLTGRVRPLDRDTLLAETLPRMAAIAGERAAATRPLVVVATQCIEVGANLDFEALVSECCPLDSLRQRFGRLDRLGLLGESESAVVIRAEQLPGEKSKPDRLYGEALARTWTWLNENAKNGRLDLGVAHVDRLLARAEDRPALVEALSAPASEAPVLLPAHVDLLTQTAPAPHVEPDPVVFLHGMRAGSPDVQVVWRADLGDDPEAWGEIVAARPPVSSEALTAPLHEVRKWLAGQDARPGGDVLGAEVSDEDEERETATAPTRVLRWRGPESDETRTIAPQEIRPGDTLVVPSDVGGCDRFGWNPGAGGRPVEGEQDVLAVSDLADVAAHARGRAALRLHPNLVAEWLLADEERDAVRQFATRRAEEEVEAEEIQEVLGTPAQAPSVPKWLGEVARHLRSDRRRRVLRHPSGVGFILSSGKPLRRDADADFTDEDDTSSAAARAVPLARHLADVGSMAERLIDAATFAGPPAGDCMVAAGLHDVGKADPRFQVLLHGGDRIAAARSEEPLAKSAGTPLTGRAFAAARERAGCPQGFRHELVSARLVEAAPALLAGAQDRELVLHLVASHHGHCRPLAPIVEDPRPVDVRVSVGGITAVASSATGLEALDSGVAERFWRLVRRYGWWGLAFLEAVTRLADHRASEDEQREGS